MKVVKGIVVFVLCVVVGAGLLAGAIGITSAVNQTTFVATATEWGKAVLSIFGTK